MTNEIGKINLDKFQTVNLRKLDPSKIPSFNIGATLGGGGVSGINFNDFERWLKNGDWEPMEVTTPEGKAARSELNKKVSSIDMTFEQAQNKIKEVREKYTDDKYFIMSNATPKDSQFAVVTLKKTFNPNALPEPDRTDYKMALAAKNELLQNNEQIAKQAGFTHIPKDSEIGNKPAGYYGIPPKYAEADYLTNDMDTRVKAQAKLDEKTSTTGLKYKDAKTKLENIQSEIIKNLPSETFRALGLWGGIHEFLTGEDKPSTFKSQGKQYEGKLELPGITSEMKQQYAQAWNAIKEIEHQNSALVALAGEFMTQEPEKIYTISLNAGRINL